MDEPSLYLVATPIGNLGDLSPRAVEILGKADFIAAEDTRKSGVLLKHFGIHKPMVSYYEHNTAVRGEEILRRLENGEVCALISDAGMPGISDPGEILVRQCHERGLRVSAIPGACAAVTALAMSGLSTRRFVFEGFLPQNDSERRRCIGQLAEEPRTVILYEAPHRLARTLRELCPLLGERRISLVREISKIYEEVRRTTVADAAAYYEENAPRGEFVLILEGAVPKTAEPLDREKLAHLFDRKRAEGLTRTAAAKELATEFGMSKHDIYEMFKNE